MTIDKYRVRNLGEQFDCECCGCPVYTGDTAIAAEADTASGVFCSSRCAVDGLAIIEARREVQYQHAERWDGMS